MKKGRKSTPNIRNGALLSDGGGHLMIAHQHIMPDYPNEPLEFAVVQGGSRVSREMHFRLRETFARGHPFSNRKMATDRIKGSTGSK